MEEAEEARRLGLDLIITDHHEPPSVLPEALAVINPKKPACPYPFKGLAGVGVAFKLAQALLGQVPEEFLEVAALGTIADLVPLVDENRVIASLGLDRMNRRHHPGLTALMEVSGIKGSVKAGHVGFFLGPRINATGRLDSADRAVRLLLTGDRTEAQSIAEELDRMNRERQQLVETIFSEAEAQMLEDPERHRRVIVVASEGWNIGVIGIVASRLVETYYRPAIVLGIEGETGLAKGSARSIEGFDIYRALNACDDLLAHYGGHPMAAGLTLPAEQLPELQERLTELAAQWLTEEDYIPLMRVDADLDLEDVSPELISQLDQLEPYGFGNPTPCFRISGAGMSRLQVVGSRPEPPETHPFPGGAFPGGGGVPHGKPGQGYRPPCLSGLPGRTDPERVESPAGSPVGDPGCGGGSCPGVRLAQQPDPEGTPSGRRRRSGDGGDRFIGGRGREGGCPLRVSWDAAIARPHFLSAARVRRTPPLPGAV